MPIPFLIGAAVIGAGSLIGAAAKATVRDYEVELDEVNRKTQRLVEETEREFNNSQKKAKNNLDLLVKKKGEIYNGSFNEFIDTFKNIKQIEVSGNMNFSNSLKAIESVTMNYHNNSTSRYIKSEEEALVQGAILGGILGGAYLVSGVIKGVRLQYAIEEAEANYSKVKVECEQVKKHGIAFVQISESAKQLTIVLTSLNQLLKLSVNEMQQIIATSGTNYKRYTKSEKERIFIAVQVAEAIKKVLDTPVLNKDGKLTYSAKEVATNSKRFLETYGK